VKVTAGHKDNTILRIFGNYLPVDTVYRLQQHHCEVLRSQTEESVRVQVTNHLNRKLGFATDIFLYEIKFRKMEIFEHNISLINLSLPVFFTLLLFPFTVCL
jgi:aromatic ring-cleaving dioxygenase